MNIYLFRTIAKYVLLFLVLASGGCGWLSDADRIVVARMKDGVIRREDLKRTLREMLPEERPFIKSRGDLLRVLEQMIDKQIKNKLAEQLKQEGKIQVPRELAAQRFDAMYPKYITMIQNAEKLGISDGDRSSLEQEREMRIDKVEKDMLGEYAVMYRLKEEMDSGKLTVTDEELQKEYELRKQDLLHFERVKFEGILFPVDQPDASALAAQVQQRMAKGESPSNIVAEFAATGKGIPISSVLDNDPRKAERYGAFWQQASGAKVGDVVGPIFIRGWERASQNAAGETVSEPIPDSFLVCKILESAPPTPKTFEQAKEDLKPIILYAKLIKKLREENQVEIYEKKLPDPAAYGGSGPKSIFDQQNMPQ